MPAKITSVYAQENAIYSGDDLGNLQIWNLVVRFSCIFSSVASN